MLSKLFVYFLTLMTANCGFIQALYAADTKQHLTEYFDCMRIENAPGQDFETFTKVYGSQKRWDYKGSTTVKGLNINLLLTPSGEIKGIEMLPKSTSNNHTNVNPPFPIVLSLEDLKSGIQFGALNTTMHTLELKKDFDPHSGGELHMGLLTEVSYYHILRDHFIRLPSNKIENDRELKAAIKKQSLQNTGLSHALGEHYNKKRKGLWREYSFKVKKQNGRWVLLDEKNQPINTIFAEMQFSNSPEPIFLGLTQIKSVLANELVNPDMQCPLRSPESIWEMKAASQTLTTNNSRTKNIDCNRN